jgi:hypothetical protein
VTPPPTARRKTKFIAPTLGDAVSQQTGADDCDGQEPPLLSSSNRLHLFFDPMFTLT